eukprot:4805091-Lingulodinium_polyedra.AAC.1
MSSIGEKSRDRVQEAIEKCLPSKDHPIDLQKSLDGLEHIAKSKLLTFAGTAMASMHLTIQGFVKSLQAGVPPGLEKAGDSPFMSKVKDCLALFLTFNPNGGMASGSNNNDETKRGQEAARAMYSLISPQSKDAPDELSFANLSLLKCYA